MFWSGMKIYVANYLDMCLACQQVKVEHQHPAGFLNPLPIPNWKWDMVSIDFIIGLPRTKYRHDFIIVVVDTLTKVAHFLLVKYTFGTTQVANVFMK